MTTLRGSRNANLCIERTSTMATHPRYVKFDQITVDEGDNARQNYTGIEELATDIKERGLIQPLLIYVKKIHNDRIYSLRAGFRRYRAVCQIRKEDKKFLDDVPCVVKSGNDVDAAMDGIAENWQRKSLSPGELAFGLWKLAQGVKQAEIAKRLGMKAPYVSRLIKAWETFDEKTRTAFVAGEIPVDAAFRMIDLEAEKRTEVVAKATEAADKVEKSEEEAVAKEGKQPDLPDTESTEAVEERKTKAKEKVATVRKKAAREVVREATRTKPTTKQVLAKAGEIEADRGYWYGVKMGLEWAGGARQRIPNPDK